MKNRDSSNPNRKANELLAIIRLAFLYGCFKRQDIENILHVNKETLNRQYGLMYPITDYIPAVPNQRVDGKLVKYEDVPGLLDELWKVHDLEGDDIAAYDDRKMQYKLILETLAEGNKKTVQQITRYCQDKIDNDGYEVKADDRVLGTARNELEVFGIIKCSVLGENGKYRKYSLSTVLETKGRENAYLCLREFIRYAVHILYPSIGGHYLWNLLGDTCRDNSWQKGDIFWFQGYQPQKILDEKNIVELQMYIRKRQVVRFSFLDNEDSRLGISKESVSQRKNVMPYRIFHDIRYGRTYLVGYCLDNQRMRGYRIDRISNIRKSREKWEGSISLEQEYENSFAGTWMGGRVIETFSENQGKKRVRLEIMNPQMNEERIRKMGITPQRHGRIQWEGEHCYYEITVPNTRDLKPWIMSLKNKVRLVTVTGVQSGQKAADQNDTGRNETGQAYDLQQDLIRTLKKMAVNYGKL